jgi:hypothetical protein
VDGGALQQDLRDLNWVRGERVIIDPGPKQDCPDKLNFDTSNALNWNKEQWVNNWFDHEKIFTRGVRMTNLYVAQNHPAIGSPHLHWVRYTLRMV